MKEILIFWAPLAAMWLFMGVEQPGITAIIARLAEAKENLAAFGITLSIALIIEAPIIQLLAAATTLADHRPNYRRLLAFMHLSAFILTSIHLILGLTPLYGLLLVRVLGVPETLLPLARSSFLIMVPWAAVIGYRRLWQGVLIRYGKSKEISLTMLCRLAATMGTLFIGYRIGSISGADLGALALSVGVSVGALAAWFFARPVVRELAGSAPGDEKLHKAIGWKELLSFYYPLAITSIVTFLARPVLSWGITRGRLPLESLAVWPVVLGLMFLFRSTAMAYQEVAVSLLKREGQERQLYRFARGLAAALGAGFLLVSITPLGGIWFRGVSGLSPDLAPLAIGSALLIVPVPFFSAFVSWYRGYLIYRRKTDAIAKAVMINTAALVLIMVLGPRLSFLNGAQVASAAFSLSLVAETLYLRCRVRVYSK
jgi:hypothetical protein